MGVEALLLDRVAIVTGAARGIGRATAELLAVHGARIVVADLDADLAEECVRGLSTSGVAVGGDITAGDTPARLVETAMATYGRIDIIVNNAGYPFDAMVHKMTDEQFERMLDIHATAPFRLIRAAAPHLRTPAPVDDATGRPQFRKIVNVASITGQMGVPGTANYAAGKAAVVGLTKSVAKEWGGFAVTCNAVCFGPIDTRLSALSADDNVTTVGGRTIKLGVPERQREAVADAVPLGRRGTPLEAAGGVLFLCAPWSDYVNGQVLNVTGGYLGGMER
jgi:3-oxoacyl-[acyl-carrier protein] reductase